MFMEELWLLLIIAGLVTSAAPSPSEHSSKLPVVRSLVSHHYIKRDKEILKNISRGS